MARVMEARSSSSSSSSSLLQLFRYADWKDKVLVLLGTMGSIGEGMMEPLTMLVLGSTINSYGAAGTSLPNTSPDKFALQLIYVAIGVGVAAFLGKYTNSRIYLHDYLRDFYIKLKAHTVDHDPLRHNTLPKSSFGELECFATMNLNGVGRRERIDGGSMRALFDQMPLPKSPDRALDRSAPHFIRPHV